MLPALERGRVGAGIKQAFKFTTPEAKKKCVLSLARVAPADVYTSTASRLNI